MASSSASTSHANDDYVFDVFLNHRGPDVKKTLATALYRSLCKHGLRVYLDQRELKEGESITPQIESAIRTASVHIAIFSPGYAHSKWCLDELLIMVDSMAKSNSTIIPVFYGVNPAELRWTEGGNGVYGRALCELEKKKTLDGQPRHDFNTIQKWRDSLSKVADLKGYDRAMYNGEKGEVFRETELLEDVVEAVLKKVKRMMHVAEYLKSLQHKLRDFETTVPLKESGKVQVIGIWGLGGVGKTTLATQFFNSKRSNYKRSCFLSDIRDKSLTTLQSELLKHLVQSNEEISSTHEGKGKLRRYLSSSEALIILDDVDHIDQLDALLLPTRDVLNTRSLILVTSRNKDLLTSSAIPESSIYQLTVLDPQDSQDLFCYYAFGQPHPPFGFDQELVKKCLDACHGLPLALKVFGALLRGENDLKYWEAQLSKFSKKLPDDIQSRLKVSYDSLDEEEKHMFLDVACFFIGEDRDTVIRIWDGCSWKGRLGLQNLQNRFLVEVDEQNRISMQKDIRDLGRDLAENEPAGCWLRFWRTSDNILDHLSGQSKVHGISMVHRNDPEHSLEALQKLDDSFILNNFQRLKLLRAKGWFVERLFGAVQNLIYLHWENCPKSFLPPSIPRGNLRVLYIKGTSLTTLWQNESQAPLQLRELNIEAPIVEVPNSIGKLKHLKKFILHRTESTQGVDLETLPDEFSHLQFLEHLELKNCEKLKSLPDSLDNLKNLQHIDLSGCSSLQMLPQSLESLTGLRHIDLSKCSSLKTLTDSIGNLTDLRHIDLSHCSNLQTLPNSLGNLTNLHHIDLSHCSNLQMLPDYLEKLMNLQRIYLSGWSNLRELPNFIGNFTGIQHIDLSGCSSLRELPNSIGKLTGTQNIDLSGCFSLQNLPGSLENLTNLQHIDLRGCSSLHIFPDCLGYLTNLQHIDLSECSSLQRLPDSLGSLTNLQYINLSGSSTLPMLPDYFKNFMNLQSIYLSRWCNLQELPGYFGNFKNLQHIDLSGCSNLQTFPEGIWELDSPPT